jgi:hypothetical protein
LIKDLNKKIKLHFFAKKSKMIKKIATSTKGDIWNAVKIAKNQPTSDIPNNITYNNVDVPHKNQAKSVADYFHEKIVKLKGETTLNIIFHNGYNKLMVVDRFFMEVLDVYECMKVIKPKMSEGYNRILMNNICDARGVLTPALSTLFSKIYYQNSIPEQWLI